MRQKGASGPGYRPQPHFRFRGADAPQLPPPSSFPALPRCRQPGGGAGGGIRAFDRGCSVDAAAKGCDAVSETASPVSESLLLTTLRGVRIIMTATNKSVPLRCLPPDFNMNTQGPHNGPPRGLIIDPRGALNSTPRNFEINTQGPYNRSPRDLKTNNHGDSHATLKDPIMHPPGAS